jgi:hypothetical protein
MSEPLRSAVGEYDGEPHEELFALRLRDAAAAEEWRNAIERCRRGELNDFKRVSAMVDRPRKKVVVC